MAKGKKTGGRVAGTPNKDNQTIMDKLAALDCDPIEGMAIIAKESMIIKDYNTALNAFKELGQYVAPKRKAIEIDLDAHVKGSVTVLTDQEIILRIAELAINESE
jgi:hypothetical protein